MGDQRNLAVSGPNRGHGVGYVDNKGRPTDRRVVGEPGWIPMYSAVAKVENPAVSSPSTSFFERPASSRALAAASP